MDLDKFFAFVSNGFGAILVIVIVALLLKDADKFNTLATASGTFVSDLGKLG